jgi:hypothetical protein
VKIENPYPVLLETIVLIPMGAEPKNQAMVKLPLCHLLANTQKRPSHLEFGDILCRGPGARALPAESIGLFHCGFRILGFSFPIRIPQSTIRNRGGPTGPGNRSCLMVSAGNALDPGPEKASKALTFT